MNPIYQFKRQQLLYTTLDKAWEFFTSPLNLPIITPPYMQFKIKTSDLPERIVENLIIEYSVSPILGIPLYWKTRISEVKKMESFTDVQEKGPYAVWIHQHDFVETPNGILMTDSIQYKMPLGILGELAHTIQVKQQLNSIFDFREKTVNQYFPKK